MVGKTSWDGGKSKINPTKTPYGYLLGIYLIYPLRSNSDHNPEAQNEHEKN